jgi:phosphoribosylglycinamide formyltransferase 1
VAVFASGGGTNLQALLDRFNATESPIAGVSLLVASREGIGAIERASRANVPWCVMSTGSDVEGVAGEMLAALESAAIDIVVLAGYMKLVPAAVVTRFRGRMVNIHPALLPGFGGAGMYGSRVHRAVLDAGVRLSGATVHLVDERYDEGPILAQWPVPVLAGDTPETLAARVLRVEHLLLPAAIERLAGGVGPHSGRVPAAFELVHQSAPSSESVRRFIVSSPDAGVEEELSDGGGSTAPGPSQD